eukprot:3838566-Rhodomonas_salina.1
MRSAHLRTVRSASSYRARARHSGADMRCSAARMSAKDARNETEAVQRKARSPSFYSLLVC